MDLWRKEEKRMDEIGMEKISGKKIKSSWKGLEVDLMVGS